MDAGAARLSQQIFNSLGKEHLYKIIDLQLNDLKINLLKKNNSLRFTNPTSSSEKSSSNSIKEAKSKFNLLWNKLYGCL